VLKIGASKRQIGRFVGHPVDDLIGILDNCCGNVGGDWDNFTIGKNCVLEA